MQLIGTIKGRWRRLANKVMRRPDESFVRQHQRQEIWMPTELRLATRVVPIPGVINEVSLGGMRFRPATTYIYARSNLECFISLDGTLVPGTIRNTGSLGYGIQLSNPLDEDQFLQIVEKYTTTPEAVVGEAA